LIKLYPAAPGRIFSDQFNNFISIWLRKVQE
jgi:hypothetical protein